MLSGEQLREAPRDPELARAESRRFSRRSWAAMMLALDLETCGSILRGLPVRAGNIDAFWLRRALRGARLPNAESYLEVTGEMLDAVAEAGPLPSDAIEKKATPYRQSR